MPRPGGPARPGLPSRLRSAFGPRIALWRDQLGRVPPYDIGPDGLFVCYSGTEAELACHLALGWPLPANIVDLMVEYRMTINGVGGDQHLNLLAACSRLGVPVLTSPDEKRRARDRVMQSWPFSAADREWILGYCADDVTEEAGLLAALALNNELTLMNPLGNPNIAAIKPFQRGNSAPRRSDAVNRALTKARSLTPEGIDFCAKVMRDATMDVRSRLRACEILLHHGLPRDGAASRRDIIGEGVQSLRVEFVRSDGSLVGFRDTAPPPFIEMPFAAADEPDAGSLPYPRGVLVRVVCEGKKPFVADAPATRGSGRCRAIGPNSSITLSPRLRIAARAAETRPRQSPETGTCAVARPGGPCGCGAGPPTLRR